jgi:arabinose-5-phosphate isomerase
MTCVVEADGRLAGVLTDGDLRRRMTMVPAPLEGTATEAMTRSPATIDPDALASAALKMMEERRITSLPVVDGNHKLVGVVHLHDLWRTGLF